jgi:hypothetical protein
VCRVQNLSAVGVSIDFCFKLPHRYVTGKENRKSCSLQLHADLCGVYEAGACPLTTFVIMLY